MKLIIFDMDGVLFEHSNVWMELHKAYGTLEEGKELTKRFLWTDYDRLVEEVVGRLWKGRDAQTYFDLIESVRFNPGVRGTISVLHKRGYALAIISSGPKQLMERAMAELGIDDGYANDLVIEDGKVAGRARYEDGASCWPIAADNKVPFVRRLCERHECELTDVIFVGDSLADLPAFKVVGKPIAFNDAPRELVDAALAKGGVHVKGNDLKNILEFIP